MGFFKGVFGVLGEDEVGRGERLLPSWVELEVVGKAVASPKYPESDCAPPCASSSSGSHCDCDSTSDSISGGVHGRATGSGLELMEPLCLNRGHMLSPDNL